MAYATFSPDQWAQEPISKIISCLYMEKTTFSMEETLSTAPWFNIKF